VSSKYEERLAGELALLAMSEGWPHGPALAQIHPLWCCEHRKARHRSFDTAPAVCVECIDLLGNVAAAQHEYLHERDWRPDVTFPRRMVIVEYEGVVYRKGAAVGRHQQGAGFAADLEKYAQLELRGWRVVRVGQRQVTTGEALSLTLRALAAQQAAGVDNAVGSVFAQRA
jgi:hypothetical protein